MNRLLIGTGAVALSLAMIGCTDNGSSMEMSDNDSQNMDSPVDFTGFVIAEIKNTSEGRDAVFINELDFSYNDQNNEDAFDELF